MGDATARSLVTNTRTTQSRRQKTVKVRLSCRNEACNVLAQGVVSLKDQGVARSFKLLGRGIASRSVVCPD